VVVSSHILSELEDYCDELLIIKDGRLSHEVATTKGDKQLSLRIRTKEIAKLKSFILEKGDGVIIREDFDTLHLLLYEREDAPAKLLQELIVADIPILEFASVTESFQERYQKQMQRINNQKNEE
jgi:ABC-2 type transport system ATP-binding protein